MPFDQPKLPPLFADVSPIQVIAYKTKDRAVPVVPSISPTTIQRKWKPKFLKALNGEACKGLPVKYMKFPEPGWWQYHDFSGCPPEGYDVKFSPRNDENTTLTFYCDGHEASDDSGLRMVLKQPAHRLTIDEMAAVSNGPKNVIKEAHTESLNGKKVVFESGLTDDDGYQVFRVEFNHNQEGTAPLVPTEIVFKAKPDKYKKYIKAVLASIRTIQWDEKAHLVP